MALSEERAAYVTLALVPGIGPQRLTSLLAACETASGALAAPFEFLCSIPGLSPAGATAIKAARLATGLAVLRRIDDLGARCLLRDDPDYPAVLRSIPDPPGVLFAQGDLSLLGRPAVAVVGSRDHSAYGGEVGRTIAGAAAAAGLVIVSGMARGLDAVAQTAALDAGGLTLGVLGNGLGVIYPAANRALYQRVQERGLLLTEFPPGDKPMAGSFPRRNRLISGLARVTLVIEAASGSGTLITVAMALEQGREVMVVPGNITSPTSVGTNRLLRDGAEPLLEVADLLRHYPELGEVAAPSGVGSAPPVAPPPPGLTPEEAAVYRALAAGPLGLDDLVARTDLPAPQLLTLVTALELRGLLAPREGRLALTNQ